MVPIKDPILFIIKKNHVFSRVIGCVKIDLVAVALLVILMGPLRRTRTKVEYRERLATYVQQFNFVVWCGASLGRGEVVVLLA